MKRSGFKMKNPSVAKLAKAAGSPMRMQSTEDITKNLNEVVANSNAGKGANVNFGTAFSNARKAGKKTFNYKGKSYTTETKQEKANRTADVGPTVKNAKNKVDLSKTTGTKNKKTDTKKTDAKKTTNTEVKPKTKKQQRQKRKAKKNKEIKAKQAQRTAKLKKFLRGFGPKKNK
tara:strand:+ start:960 stop:1481 length:522 start_codon:yes stop_codon:yes gene_type:complete